MKRLKVLAFLAAISAVTACETVAPEDYPRRVDLAWNLTPETTERVTEVVDQGEIFFQWTAQVTASHSAMIGGRQVALATAETKLGKLYCDFTKAAEACFEDRDGDGKLDHRWSVLRHSLAPNPIVGVETPKPLEQPITLASASDTKAVVAEQMLGLLYNGPYRGLIGDAGQFNLMIGDVSLGWHGGKAAPRSPTGSGWVAENFIIVMTAPEKAVEILISEIGVRYSAKNPTIDGQIELSLIAMPIDGARLDAEFDIDTAELNKAIDELEL